MTPDADRMAALRQRFVAAAGEQAELIETLLDSGDLEGVRAVAHGLAGRSALFGFAGLGEIALSTDEAEPEDIASHARRLLEALREVAQEG